MHVTDAGKFTLMIGVDSLEISEAVNYLRAELQACDRAKMGPQSQKMNDVLSVGTGVCFPTLDTLRQNVLPRTFDCGFGLALLVEDMCTKQECINNSQFDTGFPGLLKKYLGDTLKEVDECADHTEQMRELMKKTERMQMILEKDFKRLKGTNRDR